MVLLHLHNSSSTTARNVCMDEFHDSVDLIRHRTNSFLQNFHEDVSLYLQIMECQHCQGKRNWKDSSLRRNYISSTLSKSSKTLFDHVQIDYLACSKYSPHI
jgi:hypothetical protein